MTKLYYALLLGAALLPLSLAPQVPESCHGFDCSQCLQTDSANPNMKTCSTEGKCGECCQLYRAGSPDAQCIVKGLMGATGPS